MKTLRSPLIFLVVAFLAVIGVSLWVRDAVFVAFWSVLIVLVAGCVCFCGLVGHPDPLAKVGAVLAVFMLVLTTTIGVTNFPLRVAFAMLEPEFNARARQLAHGEALQYPFWIGPFRVIDGGVRKGSGAPYLMTSGDGGEIDGFVKDPTGAYFNLWSLTSLGDRWAYIQED
jgi:hypothetical protein